MGGAPRSRGTEPQTAHRPVEASWAATHVWRWRKYRGDRHGHPCRLICTATGRGPRNVMVEFEDGEQLVAPMWAIRRQR